MRVLLLNRYTRLGASSRLRSYQYISHLQQAGIAVMAAPMFGDNYVRGLSSGNISKAAVLKAYWARLRFILKARQFCLVWLGYEMLPLAAKLHGVQALLKLVADDDTKLRCIKVGS